MRLLVDLILEEHFIEIKTESDRPHDYSVKLMTGLPKKNPPDIQWTECRADPAN